MKKMNRISFVKLIIFLALALNLILLGGCGTGSEASSADQGGSKDQTQDQTQTQDQKGESDQEPGGMADFQTKDIYGNDVDQDIFNNYSLTLVNVWGTFCGPCLEEMPYLGELKKEYESKGLNIVGIVVDAQDEELQPIKEQINLARKIADETGANYTHMLVSNEMLEPVMSKFDAIPASFFVDRSGNIVSEFYIGSRSKEDWIKIIDENIEKQKSKE